VVVADVRTPSILIADDLTPSDTANLDPDMILGFITAKGGPTSHSAIIARAMGIPAIVAAGEAILDIANDTPCILDGFNGALYLSPTADEILSAQALHDEVARQLNVDFALRMDAVHTTDGHEIEVFANVNRVADAVQAVEYGAEGVGLMRTEFLFLAVMKPKIISGSKFAVSEGVKSSAIRIDGVRTSATTTACTPVSSRKTR
jgi:phosphocarrier protein FPr